MTPACTTRFDAFTGLKSFCFLNKQKWYEDKLLRYADLIEICTVILVLNQDHRVAVNFS